MNDDATPVLIVGAGPTGLLLACELARYQVPCRIIDKKNERTQTSNAIAIQPRTLELLDDIGIIDRFLKNGNKINKMCIHSHRKELVRATMSQIDSFYPFILALPQSETERILEERLQELGITLERSVELIDIQQNTTQITVQLKKNNEQTETATTNWLIACDGSHSIIRKKLNIPFPGEDIPQQFVVADIQANTKFESNEVNSFLDDQSVFALFPLGNDRFRIVSNHTEEDLKKFVHERSYGMVSVININWVSPFRIHSCVVEKMRYGTIFLAGDAAHIHSPAGGQGMNTGMQDVYNLAWKLALVIQKKAKSSLLESYHAERHPVIKDIVKETKLSTKMIVLKNPLLINLRNLLFKFLLNHKKFAIKFLTRMTQLSIFYNKSPIINYDSTMSDISPQPGERAPDVQLNNDIRIANLLRGTKHHVLLFTGLTPTDEEVSQLKTVITKLTKTYSDLIKISVIATEEMTGTNCILDVDAIAHERYNVKYAGVYLIRPDNYIAFCASRLGPIDIENLVKGLQF